MAERLERGFATNYPERAPPKSAAGFEWPSRAATAEQRMAFRKNFANLIRTKAPNAREFARQFYGETRNGQGYVMPRNPSTVLKYLDGESFPEETTARLIGAFFKTPLQQLLHDDGQPYQPLPLIRPLKASKERRKANGHAGKGNGAAGPGVVSLSAPALAASEPAPPPQRLPKGAKPVIVKIETVAGAADFVHMAVTGTVPLDVGLGIMAFIERGTHRLGPRK